MATKKMKTRISRPEKKMSAYHEMLQAITFPSRPGNILKISVLFLMAEKHSRRVKRNTSAKLEEWAKCFSFSSSYFLQHQLSNVFSFAPRESIFFSPRRKWEKGGRERQSVFKSISAAGRWPSKAFKIKDESV